MKLLIEETEELIPIPTDSYKHFVNVPEIRIPDLKDIRMDTPVSDINTNTEFRYSTITLDRRRNIITVKHGYNLRRILSFLYRKPPSSNLAANLNRLGVDAGNIKVKSASLSRGESNAMLLNLEAYVL